MSNAYVTLWTKARCAWLRQVRDRGPLFVLFGGPHISLPSMAQVKVGDTVFPVWVSDGKLRVIARMQVGRLITLAEYAREYLQLGSLPIGTSTPKKVDAAFSIRRDAKSSRYEKKTMFDFGGVSHEQLHLLAMYGARVKLQAILRALSPEVKLSARTLSVVDGKKDLLDVEKAAADSTTTAIRCKRPPALTRPLLGRCWSKPRPKQRQTSRNRRPSGSLRARHNTLDQEGWPEGRPSWWSTPSG